MPKLLNREAQALNADTWADIPRVRIPGDTGDTPVPTAPYILELENTVSIPELEHELLNQAMGISLNFPAFTDGRAYSQARELRQRGYAGEIRATGDVLVDQLLAMRRCGFSSFELIDEQTPEAAGAALAAFRNAAQPAVDNQGMVMRRLGSNAHQADARA